MRDERILRTGTKIVGGEKNGSVLGAVPMLLCRPKMPQFLVPMLLFFQPQKPQRSVTVLLCQPKMPQFIVPMLHFSATKATTFCYSATLSAKNATVPCPNATFFSHKSHNVLLQCYFVLQCYSVLCQPKMPQFLVPILHFSATKATTFCYSATCQPKMPQFLVPMLHFSATKATTFCYSATLSAKKPQFLVPMLHFSATKATTFCYSATLYTNITLTFKKHDTKMALFY
jgi:hypothetical protein